jgi:hypothetical protein
MVSPNKLRKYVPEPIARCWLRISGSWKLRCAVSLLTYISDPSNVLEVPGTMTKAKWRHRPPSWSLIWTRRPRTSCDASTRLPALG